jgi:SAM-dependent methyltransferase
VLLELNEAIQLIDGANVFGGPRQNWADLGCGSGLFTRALLSLLPVGSTVHAVDKKNTLLKDHTDSSIIFHRADFEKEDLPLVNLDGILMANSLHYIAEQLSCIRRLNKYLRPEKAHYLLIEYDTIVANQWVPYPLPFAHAQKLFRDAGFLNFKKIAERKSLFREGNIYACLID